MAPDIDGDLGCDVLIIGAGIQGLYLANALSRDGYVVCLVTDPNSPLETIDADGYFSAGYEGNDVARIQPARRAAGFWRQWAESNKVAVDPQPPLTAVPMADVPTRTRLWLDATLSATEAGAPAMLADGTLHDNAFYELANDVVLSPTSVLAHLRDGLVERHMWGEVVQFGIVGDNVIDYVNVDIGDRKIVPIVPRYTVLAANAGNAALLNLLASRFRDQKRRLEGKEAVKNSQAVRRELRVLVRGNLPALNGKFGSLTVASHSMGTDGDRVWVVSTPTADDQTVLGIDDIRFEPLPRPGAVAAVVAELFAMAPQLQARAASVTWASFVARHSQHPMAASSGPEIGRPVPAKIETLGLEGFLALWPSHLSYAMVLGDVAAERIAAALGAPGSYSEGPQPFHFPEPSPDSLIARWDQAGFVWSTWVQFAPVHDIT